MRRLTVAAAVAACLLPASGPASAKPSKRKAADRIILVVVEGRCEKLVIKGEDMSRSCKPTLLNTNAPNGVARFLFVRIDGAITTFTGNGLDQVKLNADKIVQPGDAVLIAHKGRLTEVAAVGRCTFGNPYKGVSHIHCTAQTAEGVFEGLFVTDGEKPEVTDLPADDPKL